MRSIQEAGAICQFAINANDCVSYDSHRRTGISLWKGYPQMCCHVSWLFNFVNPSVNDMPPANPLTATLLSKAFRGPMRTPSFSVCILIKVRRSAWPAWARGPTRFPLRLDALKADGLWLADSSCRQVRPQGLLLQPGLKWSACYHAVAPSASTSPDARV